MNNIVKCPKCYRWMIGEESGSHQCTCKIVDIKYKWCVKTQLDNVGEVVIIQGMDGTLYRATPMPDETLQGDDTSTDPTESRQSLLLNRLLLLASVHQWYAAI
jgi:hypothetical protein